MTKLYYGQSDSVADGIRLVPAPTITIGTEILYANDSIIGYTYTVNLNGYATAMRLLTEEPQNGEDNNKNLGKVVSHIETIRNILSKNGGSLVLVDDEDTVLLKCIGGTLRSLNFAESPNNWTAYSQYTAEIEFNEIVILDESIPCNGLGLHSSSVSPNLIDITKYRISTFTDNISFSVEDPSLYSLVKNSDTGSSLVVENQNIGVSYSVSATGKNYYVDDQLIPAWAQAKNFVQDRLFTITRNLMTNLGVSRILKNTGDDACDATDTLNTIHSKLTNNSILSGLGQYKIYNETISCSTSESDGTFSATYNSILKKRSNGNFSADNVKHTISKNINTTYDSSNRKNVSISIQGNIEGLYEGGIIRSSGSFSMPQNGTLLVGGNLANKIASAESFLNSKVINGDDLKSELKSALGISANELAVDVAECETINSNIFPSSFNITRNYMEGNISYSAEYTSSRACVPNPTIASISVSVENSTPVLADFTIPAGTYGNGDIIVQDLGTKTARKISINIEGRNPAGRNCCAQNNIESIINLACAGVIIPTGIPLPSLDGYILTQKTSQSNIIDGTYSLNLSYTCGNACSIIGAT